MRADFDDNLARLERRVSAGQIGIRLSNALCVISIFVMLACDSYYAGTQHIHDLADWKTGLELLWFVISPMPIPLALCCLLKLISDSYPRFWLTVTCLCASLATVVIYLAVCIPPMVRWGSYLSENSGLLPAPELFARSLEASGIKINYLASLVSILLELVDVALLGALLHWGKRVREIKGDSGASLPGKGESVPATIREVTNDAQEHQGAPESHRTTRSGALGSSGQVLQRNSQRNPQHTPQETLENSPGASLGNVVRDSPGPGERQSLFLEMASRQKNTQAEEQPHSVFSAALLGAAPAYYGVDMRRTVGMNSPDQQSQAGRDSEREVRGEVRAQSLGHGGVAGGRATFDTYGDSSESSRESYHGISDSPYPFPRTRRNPNME